MQANGEMVQSGGGRVSHRARDGSARWAPAGGAGQELLAVDHPQRDEEVQWSLPVPPHCWLSLGGAQEGLPVSIRG